MIQFNHHLDHVQIIMGPSTFASKIWNHWQSGSFRIALHDVSLLCILAQFFLSISTSFSSCALAYIHCSHTVSFSYPWKSTTVTFTLSSLYASTFVAQPAVRVLLSIFVYTYCTTCVWCIPRYWCIDSGSVKKNFSEPLTPN